MGEPEVEEEVAGDAPCAHCSDSFAEAETDSVSTAAPSPDNLLIQWLQGALATTMQDATVAESLATCADLVLCDGTTDPEERLENVVDMLRTEGVPEEVLLELSCHVADHMSLHG